LSSRSLTTPATGDQGGATSAWCRATRAGARARGSQLERLILDTTVLIAAERASTAIDAVIDDDDDVAIAAVTAAELLVGVELAPQRRRATRRAFVESLLTTIPIEPYDIEVATAHAVLLAYARREGRTWGAHDLLIAATARARSQTVVTADAAGFGQLPEVAVRLLRTNG
jgi:tRNA(fMet)-specific endonuclease VapC